VDAGALAEELDYDSCSKYLPTDLTDSHSCVMQEPCRPAPLQAPAPAPPSDEVTQPVLDEANKACLLMTSMTRESNRLCRQDVSLISSDLTLVHGIPLGSPDVTENINELQEWENLEEEYSVSFADLGARPNKWQNLKMLREQDFKDIGMPPVKRRRLMEAIELLTQGNLSCA